MPADSFIEFNEPEPPIQECDRLLGLFLRNWNQIEHAVGEIFHKLLGSHASAARIIMASGVNQNTLRDIIIALASQRLSKADCAKLEGLMDQIKKTTTKRNRLIHGAWRVAIQTQKDGPNTATWERFYEPTDPRNFEFLAGSRTKKKVQDAHIYPMDRIAAIITETSNLAKEVEAFAQNVTVLDFPNPQPITPST